MKGPILNLLRTEKGIVSGQALSRTLGVSRVSIWKHIRKLRELGYRIQSTSKGYRLAGSPDVLYPWEFPDREPYIHFFSEATSTMDIARDMARKGCPHFTVVIAGRQQKGRGRLNRVWRSSEGGLYFTTILRPRIQTALTPRLNFLASLVLTRTMRKLYDIKAMVKWPNDILVNGKKISGMLSEMESEGDTADFVNIGIGVNVNNDPSIQESGATSLIELLGKSVLRKELLSRFLDEFENRLDNVSLDTVIPQWKRYTMTLNRPVRIATTGDTSEGIAVDIDENGALILKQPDGSLKKIVCGDCFQ